MRVKALRSFGGQYALYKGDIAELPDNGVTKSLLSQGYVEKTKEGAEPKEAPVKDETPAADFENMSRAQMIDYAEALGIEVNHKARKDDLIKVIKGE